MSYLLLPVQTHIKYMPNSSMKLRELSTVGSTASGRDPPPGVMDILPVLHR